MTFTLDVLSSCATLIWTVEFSIRWVVVSAVAWGAALGAGFMALSRYKTTPAAVLWPPDSGFYREGSKVSSVEAMRPGRG
jgi:hypothetical protein